MSERRSSGQGQSSLGYLFGNSGQQDNDQSKVSSPLVCTSGGGQSSLGHLFGNSKALDQQSNRESNHSYHWPFGAMVAPRLPIVEVLGSNPDNNKKGVCARSVGLPSWGFLLWWAALDVLGVAPGKPNYPRISSVAVQKKKKSNRSSPSVCVPQWHRRRGGGITKKTSASPSKKYDNISSHKSYVYHKVDAENSRDFLMTGRPSTRVTSVPDGASSVGYLFGDK